MAATEQTLMGVTQARERLLSFFSPLNTEIVPLDHSAGRTLGEDIYSSLNLPPFSNSSMDGFAVRSEDVIGASKESPVTLPVEADIPAGKTLLIHLLPGSAARIMTGAPLPEGADAVVPVEDTDFNYRDIGQSAPKKVRIYRNARPGDFIRPKGQDVKQGELVMQNGIKLRPQDLGFLGMLGVAKLPLYRQPRVAILSSGDELVPVDVPLTPGKIHDSNTYTLMAAVQEAGAVPINLGIVPDRAAEVEASLDRAVNHGVDLIMSSAGVSVGAFDFVRSVVESRGSLDFWRVNMRPGKPLAFGHYQDVPFVGLPGNPVSSYVGFEVFVRPAILKMNGQQALTRKTERVRLIEKVESDGRESYLRAIVQRQDDSWVARLTGHQGSGNLRSLVLANALLVIPSGVKSLPAGEEVDAWLISEIHESVDIGMNKPASGGG
ncbi:MAG: molybdopterin molybdotransferase MoeA [Anaerolineales bacterium]